MPSPRHEVLEKRSWSMPSQSSPFSNRTRPVSAVKAPMSWAAIPSSASRSCAVSTWSARTATLA
jgi:DNA primase